MQTLQLTKAPIIASHSAVRSLADVSRNMDDEQLARAQEERRRDPGGGLCELREDRLAGAEAGARRAARGVQAAEGHAVSAGAVDAGAVRAGARRAGARVRLRAGAPPAGAPRPARRRAPDGGRRPRRTRSRRLTDEQRADLQAKLAAIDAKFPPPARATVKDFVDHIDYAVKMIGIDHVGISSDFDGGGGVDGWNGADETFNVTLELVRRGYTEEQIAKIWSGNLLRVMDEVQKVAADLQKSAK